LRGWGGAGFAGRSGRGPRSTASGGTALALVRLDETKGTMDVGDAIEASGVRLGLELAEFAGAGGGGTAVRRKDALADSVRRRMRKSVRA
jgi:hypothetical protein